MPDAPTFNHELAMDLAYEIFNHPPPASPEDLAEIIEAFLKEQKDDER